MQRRNESATKPLQLTENLMLKPKIGEQFDDVTGLMKLYVYFTEDKWWSERRTSKVRPPWHSLTSQQIEDDQ